MAPAPAVVTGQRHMVAKAFVSNFASFPPKKSLSNYFGPISTGECYTGLHAAKGTDASVGFLAFKPSIAVVTQFVAALCTAVDPGKVGVRPPRLSKKRFFSKIFKTVGS